MKKHRAQLRIDGTMTRLIGNGGQLNGVSPGSSESAGKQTGLAAWFTKVIHSLAKTLTVLNFAIGITPLPPGATPREERSFVLMWLAVIVGVILWMVALFYFIR